MLRACFSSWTSGETLDSIARDCSFSLRAHSDAGVPGCLVETVRRSIKLNRILLLGCPSGEHQKFLVLMADEFNRFRAVCHIPVEDSDGKRPGIRLRVVDSDLDVQQSVAH